MMMMIINVEAVISISICKTGIQYACIHVSVMCALHVFRSPLLWRNHL